MVSVDEVVLRAVNAWAAHPEVAASMAFLSSPAMIVVVCGPVLAWLVWRRKYRIALSVMAAMILGDALTARVLKPTFERERPCRQITGLVAVVPCGRGQSFPSGHATVAFAFLVTAASNVPRGWWWLAPPASAVAASRVALGVHYPSDVVAGALVGAGVGAVVHLVFVKRPTRLPASDR